MASQEKESLLSGANFIRLKHVRCHAAGSGNLVMPSYNSTLLYGERRFCRLIVSVPSYLSGSAFQLCTRMGLIPPPESGTTRRHCLSPDPITAPSATCMYQGTHCSKAAKYAAAPTGLITFGKVGHRDSFACCGIAPPQNAMTRSHALLAGNSSWRVDQHSGIDRQPRSNPEWLRRPSEPLHAFSLHFDLVAAPSNLDGCRCVSVAARLLDQGKPLEAI